MIMTKNKKFIFGIVLMLIAIAIGIYGKFVYFHNTEMETLFYGWKYWLASAIFWIPGIYFIEENKK